MNGTKTRQSNMELLRVVAMYMIVVYHIVCHCVNVQLMDPASMGREAVGYFNEPVVYKRLLILNCIKTFGGIGNDVFIMISGYFMANRKSESIKIGNISKKLLLQLGFASLFLSLVPTVLHFIKPSVYMYLPDIKIFNEMAWFVGYYFAVVLCGVLFLNRFLEKLDRDKFLTFLLILLPFVTLGYLGTILDAVAGGMRNFMTGIFLYSLGGYIKKFNPFAKIRLWCFGLLVFGSYVLVIISGYNAVESRIETYIRNGGEGTFVQNIPGYENYSIIILILSVCIFEIFRRITLRENKLIAFLGQSTFMVYLVHDNKFFYELWNLKDWVTAMNESMWSFLLDLLKWGGLYIRSRDCCLYML